MPEDCQINFVQMISRHGARYPTEKRGKKYQAVIKKIQANAVLSGDATFLKDYEYTLGTASLIPFGKQQMVNSGIRFVERYGDLVANNEPFIRSTSAARVIDSANAFIRGFQEARDQPTTGPEVPSIGTVLINDAGNNTLNHATCPRFERTYHELAKQSKNAFLNVMMPSIRERIKTSIQNVDLSDNELLDLMEMCAFDTIAATDTASKVSPFCNLFTEPEWVNFEYVQSLTKWSAFGHGNPLGPTQGIGFLNELYARLTGTRVRDATSVNFTLDNDEKHFPLHRAIYLDFTHDNSMIPIFSAMGLYNEKLEAQRYQTPEESGGFTSAWVVPFAARAYIERMECCEDTYIRLIVNERVVPLKGCQTDDLGRCSEEDFLENTLKWARSNGNWKDCYK